MKEFERLAADKTFGKLFNTLGKAIGVDGKTKAMAPFKQIEWLISIVEREANSAMIWETASNGWKDTACKLGKLADTAQKALNKLEKKE